MSFFLPFLTIPLPLRTNNDESDTDDGNLRGGTTLGAGLLVVFSPTLFWFERTLDSLSCDEGIVLLVAELLTSESCLP